MSDLVTNNPSHAEAEAMWSELRSALTNFDTALQRIIEARAWEPLGYRTFAEAWTDRMRGVRLGTSSMAAHVVYALIDSGMNREDALLTLGPSSGVGPAKFDTLARQRVAGVPPQLATTHTRGRSLSTVRAHFREAPSEPHVLHVELSPADYAHFKALCERRGLDFAREAQAVVRAHFMSLENRGE